MTGSGEADERQRQLESEVARLETLLAASEARRVAEGTAAAAEADRLTFELGHRVKNTLSVVQALASQTLKGSAPREEALEAYGGRILALARANDVILRQGWTTATIRSVAESVLHQPEFGGDRIAVAGPEVRLPASAALSFAMALNELASNARRHGALGQPGGTASLAWRADDRLVLVWREEGGPAAVPPETRGFGLKLVEQSLRNAFGRDIAVEFAPTGFVCTVNAALPGPA